MSQSLLKKDFIMFQGLKSQVKSYAKRMIYSYRQAQSLKYFFDKTTQYMAIHKTLKPLPLEHKEAVLDYWSKFINMGGVIHKGLNLLWTGTQSSIMLINRIR